MTIRLGLKNAFLFPSQISHISRKREAGRPLGLGPTLTPVSGPIFETKNRAIFLERFFGRGITAREQLSRAKIRSILSNHVISSNGSRADPCPLGKGNYCRNVFSSWKRRNTPRFRTILFGKEAVKTFFYKCSNSGIYESTPQPINGNKVVDK